MVGVFFMLEEHWTLLLFKPEVENTDMAFKFLRGHFFYIWVKEKKHEYNCRWITTAEARGVKQPHHVHLRDGVQTLDLNVHSHRNRRTCKKKETETETEAKAPLLFFSPAVFISLNMTPGGSVAITAESD